MTIYKGDKKIDNVYRNDQKIDKLYIGNNLVYQQNPTQNIPTGYIEIEVDATDGTYIVPFAAIAVENEPYSLNIFVNGFFHGTAEGTVKPYEGTGYEITGLTGQTAIVRIEPTGDPVVGWGRAFGHYEDALGCNTGDNKAKLLRIINDPDFTHLESETSTGDFFRAYQYYFCMRLINAAEEYIPDNVNSIGEYFRYMQYMWCMALTEAAQEHLPNSLTEIGGYFRDGQYTRCTTLTKPPKEYLPDSLTSIGDYFRYYQYESCTNFTHPAEEYIPNAVFSIGNNFRHGQYTECSNLLIGKHIHDHRFTELLNGAQNYYRMFYLYRGKNDPDTIPQYYTDLTHTQTMPITDVTPTSKKNYLTNRTGVEGYENIADNWK